jgi:hypothetical protein
MNTRRRFIEILPLAGLSLLTACSDKAAPPAPAPAPSPAPSPAPAAEPASAQAAAAPASTPAATAATTPATTPARTPAPAATASWPLVNPAEPAAVTLGYVTVASQADAAKYPKYAAGQACANCALYGGKAGDAAAPCPLYAGRLVSAKGWCSAYAKKVA